MISNPETKNQKSEEADIWEAIYELLKIFAEIDAENPNEE